MSKFYITTPIYYVNARPHIGHAYTTLAADVVSRWRKSKGDDVFFLTGTDEHGAKVAEAAKAAGKEPQEFVDSVALEFKDAWKHLGIEYSDFIRTTESRHQKGVVAFLEKLKDAGALCEGEYAGLYCTGCESFKTEKELVDGKCPDHNRAPEKVTEKNWFFKLSDYLKKVESLIENDAIRIRPESAKKEALGLIKQKLEDFSVSRENVKWGIPLPWDAHQTVYVWVEALQNYITALGYPKLDAYWPADVHLIGKDILKFHAIYWPAMLLAAGLPTPKEIFVHGYFTIDGKKMGKSLGNVIDPNELVAGYGQDAARYLLLSQFPFGTDGDVKAEKFVEQYNAFLVNGLGNLAARAAALIENHFNGTILFGEEQLDRAEYDRLMGEFKFDEVLKFLQAKLGELDKRMEEEKPWELVKKDKARAEQVLAGVAGGIVAIARELSPFLPSASEKIIAQFTAGSIAKGEPLFPRK